jgi:hypothetical protein
LDIQKLYVKVDEVDKLTGRIILPSAEELAKITRRPTVTSLPASPEYLPPIDSAPSEISDKKPEPKKLMPSEKPLAETSQNVLPTAGIFDRPPTAKRTSLEKESSVNNASSAWLVALACSVLFAALSAYLIAQNSKLHREIYALKQNKSQPLAPMPVVTTVKLESAEYERAIIKLGDKVTTLSKEIQKLNNFMKSFDYVTQTENASIAEAAPIDATQQMTDDVSIPKQ